LHSNRFREYRKSIYQRAIVGASPCGKVPTKLETYDMDGASLIEKYCDKCFEKWDK
jgi:hypothetical protein